jgi:hypothetical protein
MTETGAHNVYRSVVIDELARWGNRELERMENKLLRYLSEVLIYIEKRAGVTYRELLYREIDRHPALALRLPGVMQLGLTEAEIIAAWPTVRALWRDPDADRPARIAATTEKLRIAIDEMPLHPNSIQWQQWGNAHRDFEDARGALWLGRAPPRTRQERINAVAELLECVMLLFDQPASWHPAVSEGQRQM